MGRIGRVDPAPRQGHLAGVRAQLGAPHGDRDEKPSGVIGVDDEQRRGRAGRRQRRAIDHAPDLLPVPRAGQETLVHRDRAWGGCQGIGDGRRPVAPSV